MDKRFTKEEEVFDFIMEEGEEEETSEVSAALGSDFRGGGQRQQPVKRNQVRRSAKGVQKRGGSVKSQMIYLELGVILILSITIIITVLSYNRNMKQVKEAIASLTEQESVLTDEVILLNRDIQSYKEAILSQSTNADTLLQNVPKNPYDWTCLQTLNGRKNYIVDGVTVTKQGIDVSSFQGEIDWKKVKEDGIDYAIIRLGYRGYETGKMVVDDYYEANIQGALAAGIEVGVYYFSQAISEEEAVEEAQVVLEHLKDYDVTYPIVYDAEEIVTDTARTDGLTVHQLTDNAIAFCDYVEAAGYESTIYSNKRWLLEKLDLERIAEYDIWFAGYVDIPEYPYDFKMWQYTESGTVNGIEGNVDMNISFRDYRDGE